MPSLLILLRGLFINLVSAQVLRRFRLLHGVKTLGERILVDAVLIVELRVRIPTRPLTLKQIRFYVFQKGIACGVRRIDHLTE